MFRDVEQNAFGAVELHLEPADAVAALVHVMLAAQPLDLLREPLDVPDEYAEMVQAGVVKASADLVGLEPQYRQIDRPVAQMIAISKRTVGLANLFEIERLFIELRHRVGVLRGDCDVTWFSHARFLFAMLAVRSVTVTPAKAGVQGVRRNGGPAPGASAGDGAEPLNPGVAFARMTGARWLIP